MTTPPTRWWQISPPSRPWERWVSLSTQVVQILALFAAGWWAYTRFNVTEAPAQKQNFVTDQEMKWSAAPAPSSCYGILSVTFQNVSKSAVRIEKAMRRAWLLPLPSYDRPIAYLDPERLALSPAVDSVTYTDGPFVQTYPPQARVRYDLAWTLKRAPGLTLFRVDLFAHAADKEPIEWVYDWDENCGASELTRKEVEPSGSRKTRR